MLKLIMRQFTLFLSINEQTMSEKIMGMVKKSSKDKRDKKTLISVSL